MYMMLFLSVLYYFLSCLSLFMSMKMLESNMMIFLTFPIFSPSSMELSCSFLMDWVSLMFASTVTVISASILVFSTSYLPPKEHKRFSIILLSFILSMIILIYSNNIFFIMLGWDGLGFSSYILVVYYQNFKSSESGALTILSNRMGDIAIILAISILMSTGAWDLFMSMKFPYIVIFLTVTAAISKSAQMPFMAWLPAAMAAPTPISALVHSSTLVTAGIYLMIRIMTIEHPLSLNMLLLISTTTLLLSGLSANWEQDMKKIIALSTLSQIAMMMFAIAIKSPTVSFFHLITHAMFKSTMFLCAGSIIHGTSYQDTRAHGSSSNNSPMLLLSLGITSMALLGLPYMSGYFSKDLIIETFYSNDMNSLLILIIFVAVGLTASYSIRMNQYSTMFIAKMQKDKMFHLDNKMFLTLIVMTPSSVFLGSLLMWLSLNPQLIMIPLTMKLSTLIMISLGVMIGLTLNFKSYNFVKLGEPSITLWYSHIASCNLPLNMLILSFLSSKTDKTWMEMMSAQGSHQIINKESKLTFMLKLNSTIPIMLILLLTMLSLSF